MFKDTADWTGIKLVSENVGPGINRAPQYEVNGYSYATIGEKLIAEMLAAARVHFTPDVGITISIPEHERVGKEKETKLYVPDFVFNFRAFLWCEHGKDPELIHGLEAKGASLGFFPKRGLKYVRLLKEQKGIVIKLLGETQIRQFHANGGRLPMQLIRKKS